MTQESILELISNKERVVCPAIPVKINDTTVYTLNTIGYNIYVDTINFVVIDVDGKVINPAKDDVDDIRIQIADGANNNVLVFSSAISIWALKEIGLLQQYKGFLIPSNSTWQISISHKGASLTDAFTVQPIFAGHVVTPDSI